MKSVTFTLVSIILCLGLAACSKDKDSQPTLEQVADQAYLVGVTVSFQPISYYDFRLRQNIDCNDVRRINWRRVRETTADVTNAVNIMNLLLVTYRAQPDHCPEALDYITQVTGDMQLCLNRLNSGRGC